MRDITFLATRPPSFVIFCCLFCLLQFYVEKIFFASENSGSGGWVQGGTTPLPPSPCVYSPGQRRDEILDHIEDCKNPNSKETYKSLKKSAKQETKTFKYKILGQKIQLMEYDFH